VRPRGAKPAGNLGAGTIIGAQNSGGDLAADLAQTNAPRQFSPAPGQEITVDLLINNAGFGAYGAFADRETQRLLIWWR